MVATHGTIESSMQKYDCNKKLKGYMLLLWSENAIYTEARLSTYYKERKKHNNFLSDSLGYVIMWMDCLRGVCLL